MNNTEKTMDKIVALCKNRGFVFSGSEIYGGLSNTWDYGPLGVEFKNNVKRAWWKKFVQESPLQRRAGRAILMNPQVWVASGHVGGFSDPLMDCKDCKTRHRADKLIEDAGGDANGMTFEQMSAYIKEHGITCPDCGSHQFYRHPQVQPDVQNLPGRHRGRQERDLPAPRDGAGHLCQLYQRAAHHPPQAALRRRQIGKTFRNEITPGNFTFRTREFEQMELEFFCKPDTDLDWFYYWKDFCKNWLLALGMTEENMRLRDHEKEELSFYSKATTDIEYLFPFGWGELWGIADRTDYDLKPAQRAFGQGAWTTLTPRQTSTMSPTWSSPRWAPTAWRWRSCATPTTRRSWTRRKRHPRGAAPASGPGALQGLRAAPVQKADDKARGGLRHAAQSISWWITTTPVPSASGTAARMRSARRSASPTTLTRETDGCVTVRDRDTMQQERIKIEELVSYIEGKIAY